MNHLIETERLYLREMSNDDYASLSSILQDGETMYAYEGAFSDEEVKNWMNWLLDSYKQHGHGLWAVVLKANDEMIGQCGITLQNVEGKELLEVGYLFHKNHWHKGYAAEAARGCRDYAFNVLKADAVYSIIRDTNIASMNVAIRNGMHIEKRYIKHYRGIDMPHFLFVVRNEES